MLMNKLFSAKLAAEHILACQRPSKERRAARKGSAPFAKSKGRELKLSIERLSISTEEPFGDELGRVGVHVGVLAHPPATPL